MSMGAKAAATIPFRKIPFRYLGFGLLTVLGLRRRGFFIPHRYAESLPDAAPAPPYAPCEALFDRHRADFAAVIAGMDAHADALLAIGREPPPQPRWRQDWFPRLDGAAAYALVRRHRPRRIVEIGCGHSTRFLARAVRDGGIACTHTVIDPQPRADIGNLPVTLTRALVQRVDSAPFTALEAGDMLFIDGSHILVPGSDADWLFNRVLPALRAGVLIHIHDILLPDPYPPAWRWRGYNEQSAVAALLSGGAFTPLFASRYAATRMAAEVAGSVAGQLPLPGGAVESSLWLRKVSAPLGALP